MDKNDNELLKLVPFLEKLVELVCLVFVLIFSGRQIIELDEMCTSVSVYNDTRTHAMFVLISL